MIESSLSKGRCQCQRHTRAHGRGQRAAAVQREDRRTAGASNSLREARLEVPEEPAQRSGGHDVRRHAQSQRDDPDRLRARAGGRVGGPGQ